MLSERRIEQVGSEFLLGARRATDLLDLLLQARDGAGLVGEMVDSVMNVVLQSRTSEPSHGPCRT